MKKIIIFALTLFLLVSCSDAQEYDSYAASLRADDEADRGFLYSSETGFCESPDAYYYIPFDGGNMIHFIDKKSGVSGPLCAKLECTHDNEDCNASAPMCSGLSFYEGKLWWVGKKTFDSDSWAIFRSNPDGTDRKTVREIDGFSYRRSGTPDSYGCITAAFHKGYLYLSYASCVVEDGVPCAYLAVTKTSLSNNDETEAILYERVETSSNPTIGLIPVDDKIYYYTFVRKIGEDRNFDFKVYEYGAEGVSELYSSIGKEAQFIPNSFGISPESQPMFSDSDYTVYTLKNGEFTKAHSFKEHPCIYYTNDKIAAIYPGTMLDETVKILITDYNYKTIFEGSFNIEDLIDLTGATSVFCEYRGVGTDAVILWCQSFTSSNPAAGNYNSSMNNYYISVPLDGGEVKIVSEFHR